MAATENDFDLVFAGLAKRQVRYLVVGGVAVVPHGVLRFTADLALVLALDTANVLAALDALAGLAYRPRAPVSLRDFADPASRRDWIEDQGHRRFLLADRPYANRPRAREMHYIGRLRHNRVRIATGLLRLRQDHQELAAAMLADPACQGFTNRPPADFEMSAMRESPLR